MTHLEEEIEQLHQAIVDMMILASSQLVKTKEAFLNCDLEIAEEVRHHEKRMNAIELSIDRDCENIFALFQPVATDLRFVIAMLKINSDLERIGDLSDGIADYVGELDKPLNSSSLEAVKLEEMFDITISMMANIQQAYQDSDTQLARKVFKMDKELNELNKFASRTVRDIITCGGDEVRSLLFLFSTIRKLERTGDHVKNVAEDIIFHLEAEVLKHRKKKK